jgi:hypothetical protein
LSKTDCKILADGPELAGNPVFSFRFHVAGEKLLVAINEVDALAEWLEPLLTAEKIASLIGLACARSAGPTAGVHDIREAFAFSSTDRRFSSAHPGTRAATRQGH